MNTQQIQESIIHEFTSLKEDPEMMLTYLTEIGEKLSPLDESQKTEDNLVKGCQSKVWLTAKKENEKIHYSADSNTAITKGLIALLLKVLSNQTIHDILNTDLFFIEKTGLSKYIGTQRSNGFLAMIKQMKYYALALS